MPRSPSVLRRLAVFLSLSLALSMVAACGDNKDGSSPDAPPRPDATTCTPVDDGNDCTDDVCEAGVPVHTPVAAGTSCATGQCDGSGTCVALASCTDTVQNGDETGIDCGGSCAPASTCADGEGCMVAGDCTSGVCTGDVCQVPACGDGVPQAGEMCDDGNQTNGDGCDDGVGGNCRPTGCGNAVVTGTEECDDGNDIDGDGCDSNCTATACGNDVTTTGEECDDGNTADSDGCSAACAVEVGYTCTPTTPSVCSTTCGDGIPAGTEECDDTAPAEDGDGCSATCTVESGYTCTGTPSTCTSTAVCGDGMMTGTEACDDGNAVAFDGCSPTCTLEATEIEPNEDGATSAGAAGGIAGNDFDSAGGIAVMNANTNGAIQLGAGLGTMLAAITPAGDEDVFAIHNDTAVPQSVRFDLWNLATGYGAPCPSTDGVDTGLNLRDAAGTVLINNDDRDGSSDRCSGLSVNMTPGATVYAHVVEYNDDAVIPGYGLTVVPTAIVCGDATQTLGFEECDDGNLIDGDGCSATCTIEGATEVEPNEDGTVSTGGSGVTGNDFDVGGTIAINNAIAQGVTDVGTAGQTTWLAALTPAGDEDVFALTNTAAGPVEVTVDTWDPALGIGRPCTIDTGLNIRDSAGVVLTSNDQRATGDNCSRATFLMPAGTDRYVHVTEYGDNAAITRYVAQITQQPVVCGDGILVPAVEECDDGNTDDTDACTNACLVGGTVNEVEPNDTTAQADVNPAYSADAQIRGSIGTTTDVDYFRVDVATFTVLRLETFVNLPNRCDSTTTTVRIMDSAGLEITNDAGSSNASGIASCAALTFPADPGTYYVKVEETGVNATIARYFLQIDFATGTGSEAEPAGMTGVNDTSATAETNLTTATAAWVSGDHTLNADGDFYAITVPPGQALRAEIVEGDRATKTCESQTIDSRLTLFDTNGTTQLVDDDDDGRGYCSAIDGTGNTPRDANARNTTTDPKVFYLEVRASTFAQTGGDGQFVYRLSVTVR